MGMANTISAMVAYVLVTVLTFGAWGQHFMTTIKNEDLLMFMLGIIPPVGMVHGWLIWMGVA